jgi:hypothetical protein
MSHHRNLTWPATIVLSIIINSSLTSASAAPLSGTRTIGPTGDYVSITAAIADVQAETLEGALVLELQTNYVCTVETFPLVFGNLPTTAANTLTLRPQLGAANLLISSAVYTAATVDLNGAQFVTIDGRPGGVGGNAGSGGGTASQLTIANTSTIGRALRFINGAGNNTLCYTALLGVNTSTTSGVILFSTTTGANGNDNNMIDHCDLHDGASTPANCLYASGSSGTPAQNNSGNTVANCNIFNFSATQGDQYGIRLDGGNTGWTITGNSFYQTASRTGGHTVGAIFINNPSGNNFVVSGNAIGGTAPNAGSAPWTSTGTTTANTFAGITLNVGSAMPGSVQGNVIQNFSWLTSQNPTAMPGIWGGITVSAGSVNIGTVTGNLIGNGGSGSISVTTSGSGALTTGITSTSTNMVVIANNTVSSITVYGTTTSVNASLTGIEVTAGVNIISNNIVGGTTTGQSLNAATPSTSTIGSQVVTGIFSSSSNSASITGNTVANFNNNYANIFTGQVWGIITSDGVNTITGNSVYNLATTSADGNDYTSSSVLGISQSSTQAGQIVSQNTVQSLANTTLTEPVSVVGIYFAGPVSGTNLIARNLVHSLAISSTNTSSVLYGLYCGSGLFTAQNNMVRVGLGAGGNDTAGAASVAGIYDLGSVAGRDFYHNSVYVGGAQTSGKNYTAAFFSYASGNALACENNIFDNARSKSGGTGGQYAVVILGTTLAGLTEDGNLFLASGAGGVLGHFSTTDYTTLAAWQAATGLDADSFNVDPLYLNPAGSAATVDLHIAANSPAIKAGLPVGVTDDFDGNLRNPVTPTIGADESSYAVLPGYNQLSAPSPLGGTNVLSFLGTPNINYALETATNLVPPVVWQPLLTNGAAPNGWLFFTNVPSQSPVFYRTRYVP